MCVFFFYKNFFMHNRLNRNQSFVRNKSIQKNKILLKKNNKIKSIPNDKANRIQLRMSANAQNDVRGLVHTRYRRESPPARCNLKSIHLYLPWPSRVCVRESREYMTISLYLLMRPQFIPVKYTANVYVYRTQRYKLD